MHRDRSYPEPNRIAADVALARRDFQAMAAVLEKHLQGRIFVGGDHFTAADIELAYNLDVAGELQLLGLSRVARLPRAHGHAAAGAAAGRGASSGSASLTAVRATATA